MIQGIVTSRREAVISLPIRGPGGASLTLDVIIDTGFSGLLALSPLLVASLGLPRQSGGRAVMADGNPVQFEVFAAEIEWDGNWRMISVFALGNEPLLGMKLLDGHELRIAVNTGGVVEITPLP